MSPACGHDKEVARKTVFIEIVVGQVKNLDAGQRPEPSRQLAQLVDAKVEDPEPGHAAQGLGHLLQQVVEQVEDLEVLHHCHGGGKFCDLNNQNVTSLAGLEEQDLVVTESQPGDVLHGPEPRHVRLQAHQLLVTEVNLRILHAIGLLNGLLDDLGSHA